MTTLDLFDGLVTEAPSTEGIKYAGSKLKLLQHILSLVRKERPQTVLDGFSGTTRVSQTLARSGYTVIANDASVWSEVFGNCYLLNEKPAAHFQALVDHLNSLPLEDGWFTEHYGGAPGNGHSAAEDGLKKPWQRHNTRKLDAIRKEIDRLDLPFAERAVLLTSLILALDTVDSTLGHFVSYLNEWSPRSYKEMKLKVPAFIPRTMSHAVHRKDIFELVSSTSADLAYFDPPYGSNNEKMPPSRVRYGAYYHLWTTICLNDRPDLFGKAKRRTDTADSAGGSVFEDFRRSDNGRFIVVESIERLLKMAQARHIVLSYSSGGRATAEELHQVIAGNARLLEVAEIDYRKNVMASMRWTNDWIREAESPNREFLFLMEKK